MITDIGDYFAKGCGRCPRFDTADCAAQLWRRGLADLRKICLAAGLEEAVKWGHPCYMHAGRNIAIIGAFRSDFRLSFFNAGLMQDPEKVLEKQGANTEYADCFRFTNDTGPTALEAIIKAYLEEAKGYAAAGLKAPKVKRNLDLPEELVEALDADPELAEAFAALTPGRQKSYVLNLSAAKASETRVRRIVKFREKIIAGKGAMER